MFFASDNASGVPPEILAALAPANDGYAPSYGDDPIMARVTATACARSSRRPRPPSTSSPPAPPPTRSPSPRLPALGRGVLPRATPMSPRTNAARPSSSPAARSSSLVEGAHGKIDARDAGRALARTGAAASTASSAASLSLTNVTEAGTVYVRDRDRRARRARHAPQACPSTWTARASPTRSSPLGCQPRPR